MYRYTSSLLQLSGTQAPYCKVSELFSLWNNDWVIDVCSDLGGMEESWDRYMLASLWLHLKNHFTIGNNYLLHKRIDGMQHERLSS